MPRTPKFAVKNTSRGWCVNTPATLTATGERERSYFSTREKAQAFSSKLREQFLQHGSKAQMITPSLAEAATAASRLLEPFNISLLDAVRFYVEAETKKRASVTVSEAVGKFRAAGIQKWSDKQATAYRLRGDKLIADFGDRTIASITGDELQSHIEKTTGGPGASNHAVRLIRALWNWCERPPRKWCQSEAIKHLEVKETTTDEIGILSSTEAATLLRTAEKHHPDTVPGFAIALFTGMRQAELSRLVPADVNSEGIRVPAASAKTRRRRFINMSPTLAAWLKAYTIGDTVLPPNWKRKEVTVRRLAGWKVWTNMVVPAVPPNHLPKWPDNALRHTHATVAIATGATLETLTFEFGHSGGSKMLRSHYVGAMPKAEAEKILRIGPHGKVLSLPSDTTFKGKRTNKKSPK